MPAGYCPDCKVETNFLLKEKVWACPVCRKRFRTLDQY